MALSARWRLFLTPVTRPPVMSDGKYNCIFEVGSNFIIREGYVNAESGTANEIQNPFPSQTGHVIEPGTEKAIH